MSIGTASKCILYYREQGDAIPMSQISVLNSNCNCPKTDCPRHGNCMECVEFHKANSKKIPFCLRFMVEGQRSFVS